jgi:hypothetical protein
MAELYMCQQQQPEVFIQTASGPEPLLSSSLAGDGAHWHADGDAADAGGRGNQPSADAIDARVTFPLFELL